MPISRLLFFLGIVLCLRLISPSYGSDTYALVPGNDVQQLVDWGITISPVDWDGNLMLRDPQKTAQLCQRLNVTSVRILIGGINVYDNQRKKAQRRTVNGFLVPQVRALAEVGVGRYILSFLTAPSALKIMYSYQPYVDGIRNRIRPGDESAMSNYIVDIVKILKEENLQLPYAISIQTEPSRAPPDYGCPPTLVQGTLYTYDEWSILIRDVRDKLDRASFRNVGIIGPESSDNTWQTRVAEDPAFLSTSSPLSDISFLGRKTASSFYRTSKSGTDSKVWMLASDPTRARSENERILVTFEDMYRDLSASTVSHWFFRYLYGPDPSPEVLVFGRDRSETPLFRALADLWNWIKPPAKVSLCYAGNKDEKLFGLRLHDEKTGHIALLIIQPDLTKGTISLVPTGMQPTHGVNYTPNGSSPLIFRDSVEAPINIESGVTLVFGLDK